MLDVKHFAKVASCGFGDPHNSYTWSMEWFKGRLYVGTNRDILWMFARLGDHTYLDPYPVALPPRAEMDLRGQIWCYTPETSSWEQVYTSPLITTSPLRGALTLPWRRLLRARRMLDRQSRRRRRRAVIQGLLRAGREWVHAGFMSITPREIGYRNMAVFTDQHGTEALYVVSTGAEGHILRTTDGSTFEALTNSSQRPLMAFGFRPLVPFKGRLYTSPVGSPMFPNISVNPVVLETDDPARGAVDPSAWRPVSTPGFGDRDNISIFEMAVFRDHLYAGVGNLHGFQVWKTAAAGSPPYRWTQVVTNGGHHGPSGLAAVISMCPFGEWLYVGSGRAVPAIERLQPIPGELIRIAPDDTWEVVAGARRETPQGIKTPISGMPGGFGNPLAMYVWRMEEHDGWLYAGVNDPTTLLRYIPKSHLDACMARWVDRHGGVERIVEAEGGFDLWGTPDGLRWTCITHTGFGNPFNNGVRTLKSTPVGLFVGTMNFFTEAKDPTTGDSCGGTEIWVGAS